MSLLPGTSSIASYQSSVVLPIWRLSMHDDSEHHLGPLTKIQDRIIKAVLIANAMCIRNLKTHLDSDGKDPVAEKLKCIFSKWEDIC